MMAVEEFGLDEGGGVEEQWTSGDGHAPLQNYFTMPFALHLRPLPHISFLAHQESAESSEGDLNDGASTSSHGSNYRAGMHRLKPVLQSVPPHSLSTISILLERTGCLEAVPIWARLITLLDQADEDAQFTNLRQFFDARFDSEGRLIRNKDGEASSEDEKDKGIFRGGSGLFKRTDRRSSQAKNRSPSFVEEGKRRGSYSSRGASNAIVGRSKSRLGLSFNQEDRSAAEEGEVDSSVGGNVRSQTSNKSNAQPRRQPGLQNGRRQAQQQQTVYKSAPEILVPRQRQREGGSKGGSQATSPVRPVRFKVRLDLHNVKLAPRPPRIPSSLTQQVSGRKRSQLSTQQQVRLGTSPDNRLREGGEVRRVASTGASSDHSFVGSLSLRPVTSPESMWSQPLSDGSHSDEHHGSRRRFTGQSDPISFSPSQGKSAILAKQSSVGHKSTTAGTRTASSTANTMSDFGTGSDGVEDSSSSRKPSVGYVGSVGGSMEEGKRRPSIIQRLMGLSTRKTSFNRKRSTTSSTNRSNASQDDDQPLSSDVGGSPQQRGSGLPLARLQPTEPAASETALVTSPTTLEVPGTVPFVIPVSTREEDRPRLARTAEQSDWSNEEALDTADDEGSIASSSGWAKLMATKRRTSSSGASPNPPTLGNPSGLKMESDLRPVHEDRVFDGVSVFSGNFPDDADIEEEDSDEGEGEEEEDWQNGGDFLSLLRAAADKTLHLKPDQPDSAATEQEIRTPKSSSTRSGLHTPSGSVQMEEKLRAEALLAAFLRNGHEENAESWWLCGSSDPLSISFACALSPSLGWKRVMELCYGRESQCERAGMFESLSKAAELNGKQENDSSKVRNWAQAVSTSSVPNHPSGEEGGLPTAQFRDRSDNSGGDQEPVEMLSSVDALPPMEHAGGTFVVGSPAMDDDLAPSESISVQGDTVGPGKQTKLAKWMNRIPGRSASTPAEDVQPDLFSSLDQRSKEKGRTWQDWAALMASIGAWMEEYETSRIRSGMARELDREPSTDVHTRRHDSGFVEAGQVDKEADRVVYASKASYQVPRCVALDALEADHGFRRRHGIPEGLPAGPDGQEMGDYRWARSKLSCGHFATSLLLATNSLSYFFSQLATSEWTYNSSWELDYLEMCVFHSQIISTRFPSPGPSIVPYDQVYQPRKDDEEGNRRAMTCPYPRDNAWHADEWLRWLRRVHSGTILVPAVSWQAWWTLIAVLNGADGSGRALDLQVKAAEEPFAALDDMDSIYI